MPIISLFIKALRACLVSSRLKTLGLHSFIFLFSHHLRSISIFSLCTSGFLSLHAPQKTPTIEQFFNKGRLVASLAIVPDAKPIINNLNAKVRKSSLTRWRNGYSIKTNRYRLTQWGSNGELGYELYDNKSDKNELINLPEQLF